MRKSTLLCVALFVISILQFSFGQENSATIQFDSQDKGILIPRMSANQWVSIVNPADGLMVYDSSQHIFYFFNGNSWQTFSTGAIGPEGVGITAVTATDAENGLVGITFNLSDGSVHMITTPDLRGPQGDPGVGIAQTITRNGTEVSLSDGGGAVSVDDADADPANEKISSMVILGDSLVVNEGSMTLKVAVDSSNTNELQSWTNLPGIPSVFSDNLDNVDDADADPANEKISSMVILGDSLVVNEGSMTLKVAVDSSNTNELQSWTNLPGIPSVFSDNVDDVDDADNDPVNEKISELTMSGDTLSIIEGNTTLKVAVDVQTLSNVLNQDSSANNRIKNLIDPIHDQDAATKIYVDNAISNAISSALEAKEDFALKNWNKTGIQGLVDEEYSIGQLIDVGFSTFQLLEYGFSIMDLYNAGVTITELIDAGQTPSQLLAGGITSLVLFTEGITPAQLLAAGVSVSQLLTDGVTVAELIVAGQTPAQLIAGGVTSLELLNEGITPTQLFVAGVSVSQLLIDGVTVAELIIAGYSPTQLLGAGITSSVLLDEGITPTQLMAAGVTVSQLLTDGVTVAELMTITNVALQQSSTTQLLSLNYTVQQLFDQGATESDFHGVGYGGGLIYYIDSALKKIYIAAPSDQGVAPAGCGTGYPQPDIPGSEGILVGTGKQNTTDIVAGCAELGIAAKIAVARNDGTYADWYLPSVYELTSMYHNLKLKGFSSYTFGRYWSSSESVFNGNGSTFNVDFRYGSFSSSLARFGAQSVRAVRDTTY